MKSYKILFKLTSRSRPERFFETLTNITFKVSDKCKYHIHCTLDEDDPTMNNPTVIHRLGKYKRLSYTFGRSKNKIDAINRDMDKVPDWDILVNMSDDMRFTLQGFDSIICNAFFVHFENLDGCLHLPDGNQNENLITLAILGRKYYERFGYIYHPDYISLWCDTEMTDVAKMLGKYRYVNRHVYKHMHPSYGLSNMDEQYRRTESFFNADKQTYERRKATGFT